MTCTRAFAQANGICLRAAFLVVVLALTACGSTATAPTPLPDGGTPTRPETLVHTPAPSPTSTPTQETPIPGPDGAIEVQAPLVDPGLNLRAGPVPVPLRLVIPSIEVDAPVVGVGLNDKNVMDAPGGDYGDPMYQTAFWYRGGAEPGAPSTASIAGDLTGMKGEPVVFARLEDVEVGDRILVQNTETGRELTFQVTEARLYSVEEANVPAVLERIYGRGPLMGAGPLPSPDGVARLTLITCGGEWTGNGFAHRFVVYAEFVES
jgi:sortase (surface protein transpeptidase)